MARTAGIVVSVALAAVLLGACSSAGSTPVSNSSSSDGSGTTAASSSTTTTTTLPIPVSVPGTRMTGSYGFLGKASRVRVAAIPDGLTSAPLPGPGTPAYLGIDRIAFRHFGSGPDLVLINGEDATMASWSPVFLDALAQHYRVTIFDLPGTGYSGPTATGFILNRWADDTAGLIQALQLIHPAVLGWGLGGEVALDVAERHPGSIGALVLADTSSAGPSATPPRQADMQILASPLVTETELAGVFFSSRYGGAESAWLAATSSVVPDDLAEPSIVAEARLQRALWASGTLTAGLSAIHLRALVVSGSDDRLFPAPDGSLLSSSIAGAKEVVYQGADYASMFELTTRFVTALEAFTG